MSHVTGATDVDLVAALRRPGPLLVEFWMEGCGPCTMFAPVLEAFARDMPELPVLAYRLEYRDPARRLWKRHGIHATPTLILFQGGVEVWRGAGYRPQQHLRREIETALGGHSDISLAG